MTAGRALAGAAAVGQGRSREAVARNATALTDWRWSGLFVTSGLARIFAKYGADGARIVDILDVLSKTYGKGDTEGAQKLKSLQPCAPGRRRRFYLAFISRLSRLDRLPKAAHYDNHPTENPRVATTQNLPPICSRLSVKASNS